MLTSGALLSERPPFRLFVRDIANRLLAGLQANMDSHMDAVMQDIGLRYGVGRVQLRWIDVDSGPTSTKASWFRDRHASPPSYKIEELPWVIEQMRNRVPICVGNMQEMPKEASADRIKLSSEGIKAFFLSPLEIDGRVIGVLALGSNTPLNWEDATRDEIAALSPVIAGAYWGSRDRESLARSEARYRAVVQDQTELIVRWTPEGTTTWANDAACQYLGKTRAELVGNAEHKFVAAAQWDELQDQVRNLTPDHPVNMGEYRVPRPDGEIAWQEWSDRGIFDEQGVLVEIQSVGRDVTSRKIAEETIAHAAEFQRIKADLQADLMSINFDDGDSTFERSLNKLAHVYAADRIHIWHHGEGASELRWQYRWIPEGISPAIAGQTINVADARWFLDQSRGGDPVVINRRAQLPPEAGWIRQLLETANLQSFVGIPLTVDGESFGFCTVAAERRDAWNDLAVNELRTLSMSIAMSIARYRTVRELKHRAKFETTLATVSASLRDADVGDIDPSIKEALSRIGADYGLDRVNVTWIDKSLPGFGKPIDWTPSSDPIETVSPQDLTWGMAKILRGETVQIDDVEMMPAEAHKSQAIWRKLDFSSMLALPLRAEGRVFGAASFARQDRRDWDDGTIRELKLLANAITTAAIRQWSDAALLQRQNDLARSQRDAGVGSYKVMAKVADDGTVEYLGATMSEHGKKLFCMNDEQDFAEQIISRVHPDDVREVRRSWRNMIISGKNYESQYRIVQPDGSVTHIQSRAEVDTVDETGITTVFGTIKDVTEWVESGRQLQQAMEEISELKDQLQKENLLLKDEVRAAHGFNTIIGDSEALRKVLRSAEQVAPTDVTVLVTGETGTGKELVARSIHELSHRSEKIMVSVNCAALAPELIASELFGHEKGAFTGAHELRKGRFELANGGTLFLDEIGEMAVDIQAKLLRVIQEGEFERLGGTKTLKTDVRLVAATNRDLQKAVDEGEFRADLFYRINSFPIHLPPLRERKEDIPLLVEHLTRKHADIMGKNIDSIAKRTMRFFRSQDWPGNVRELEGTIVRALITSSGNMLDYGDAVLESDALAVASNSAAAESFVNAQRMHILEALDRTNWVIEGKNGAARVLGLAPSSLRSKMKRLEIVRPD